MLQAAINSCSVVCNLMLTRALSIGQEVFINPNVAVFSTAQALLIGTGQGAERAPMAVPGVGGMTSTCSSNPHPGSLQSHMCICLLTVVQVGVSRCSLGATARPPSPSPASASSRSGASSSA